MDWERTRITEEQFKEHSAKCTHRCDIYPSICRERLQAQVSFRAGAEEVVKAIDPKIKGMHHGCGEL